MLMPIESATEETVRASTSVESVIDSVRKVPAAGRHDKPSGENPTVQANVPQKPRKRFSRSWINFWLDAVLAAAFVAVCAVAAVIQVVFPAPTLAAGWTLWGATIDQWFTLQFGCLCFLGAGIVLHVMLHWSWVCGMLTRGRPASALRTDDGIRTIVGVGFLIAVLGVIGVVVLAGVLTVTAP